MSLFGRLSHGFADATAFRRHGTAAAVADCMATVFDRVIPSRRSAARVIVGLAALLFLTPREAHASLLSPEAEDKVATCLALFVLFVVPVALSVLFWMVHVLPEKIAHKRHHPQLDAIRTLCLLSLVFGGLLWPLAWIWAYTKPVMYRVAYGTDKHDDYFDEMAEKHRTGKLLREEARHLREELEAMEARGALPPKLQGLKEELDRLRAEVRAEEEAKAKAA